MTDTTNLAQAIQASLDAHPDWRLVEHLSYLEMTGKVAKAFFERNGAGIERQVRAAMRQAGLPR